MAEKKIIAQVIILGFPNIPSLTGRKMGSKDPQFGVSGLWVQEVLTAGGNSVYVNPLSGGPGGEKEGREVHFAFRSKWLFSAVAFFCSTAPPTLCEFCLKRYKHHASRINSAGSVKKNNFIPKLITNYALLTKKVVLAIQNFKGKCISRSQREQDSRVMRFNCKRAINLFGARISRVIC